ncbi:MAG: alpha-L-fucosidase [Clostridia bacterium]|nr:alpha-L-fucosidase [Clostridia bacterium]
MQHFEATFDSLYQYEEPQWIKDGKFGIWAHWGPQSVPMFGDWYARNMYIQGTPQYEYHIRHYGHPSKFGYKDICDLWKAEKFDPASLMDKYVKAGAKYFVAQASHHDHFFTYNSQVNAMNSVNVGPHRDILLDWKKEADRHGLPFGISEHLGASFTWWRVNKGADKTGPYAGVPYDGNDPAYRHFYHDNASLGTENPENIFPWYTTDPAFQDYWVRAVKEMIDHVKPDLLYTDGALPFCQTREPVQRPVNPEEHKPGLEVVAHLYNTSIDRYGENRAVYLQKDVREEIARVGTLDVEKSQLPGIAPRLWHTDTCIGNWFYDVHHPYKSPEQIVEMLVDIISKNGVMLLNVLQRPDGTIDEDADWILEELSRWFAVCGEAVYGTRPWHTFSEGETRVKIQGFTEDKTNWTPSDFRFVQKNGTVYAFMLGIQPGQVAAIRSFSDRKVSSARLLGAGEVPFRQEFGLLTVKLPEQLPVKAANALAITLE